MSAMVQARAEQGRTKFKDPKHADPQELKPHAASQRILPEDVDERAGHALSRHLSDTRQTAPDLHGNNEKDCEATDDGEIDIDLG